LVLEKKYVELELGEIIQNKNELDVEIYLYCAILKRENFELVAQKTTELGVSKIIPIITDRTVKQGLKIDRLEKIIREAAEQSGRGRLPDLSEAVELESIMENELEGVNVFFHVAEIHTPRREYTPPLSRGELPLDHKDEEMSICLPIKKDSGGHQRINLFVGPEGGWSKKEIEIAEKLVAENKNWQFAKVSPTTLRAETAAIISVFWANNFLN